jgi:hypothetical protein
MVWQRCPSRYNGTHLVVLLKLAGLSARKGYAHIRVPVLGTMCGVNERAIQKTVKRLKKDGLLTVKYRKGRSSLMTLNIEEIQKLPLAIAEGNEEQPQTAEPPKASVQPGAQAAELAQRIYDGIPRLLPDSHVPDNWQKVWPAVLQPLFDAGHSLDTVRLVGSCAFKSDAWRKEMTADPVGTLVQNFTAFHRLWQASQNKEAA